MEKWDKKRHAGITGQTWPIRLPAPFYQLQRAFNLTLRGQSKHTSSSLGWRKGVEVKTECCKIFIHPL